MTGQGSGRSLAKRLSSWLAIGALLCLFILLILWYRTPPLPTTFPPTVEHLDRQMLAAGVENMFPNEYAVFHQQVSTIRQRWRLEANRLWPSWTPEQFSDSYQQLMHAGTALLETTDQATLARHTQLEKILDLESAQLARLRNLNGDFDLRGKRMKLSRAEGFLSQGVSHLNQGKLDDIPHLVTQAQDAMHPVESFLIQQMNRYTDKRKIDQWNQWVKTAINHSRLNNNSALVVIKASREFRLYQNGRLRYSHPTELGFSGMQDKLYEGDGATPEGVFHIVKKKVQGETKFHKAFLLNFPTAHHSRQFHLAKTQGEIPANRGIGGLIEIHGQRLGQQKLTDGCVALNNAVMDMLFPIVPVHTPVVIVGTLDPANPISQALAPIQHYHQQRQSLVKLTTATSSHMALQ